ncbi:MAG TPA: hypothetical protein VFA89_24550 [Terriglobales bacterium]|nr:hypothetical protein [Terriglobales bacterium]
MQYSEFPPEILRCQHIRVNGTLCGSPALRRSRFCFFHKKWHDQRIAINHKKRRSRAALDLPVLEDANSVQIALMQVMRLILANQIDGKTAGLLLYALQTASVNLRHTNFQPMETHVVINPRAVKNTPLGVDPWSPDDDEYQEECECQEEQAQDEECGCEPGACQCGEARDGDEEDEIQDENNQYANHEEKGNRDGESHQDDNDGYPRNPRQLEQQGAGVQVSSAEINRLAAGRPKAPVPERQWWEGIMAPSKSPG